MSNPKQILKAKCNGEVLLLWLALCRPRRQLPAISSNGSLEYTRDRRLRHYRRRLTAVAERQHDEDSTKIIAAKHLVSSASDRTTSPVL
jgi:hypothetical protein